MKKILLSASAAAMLMLGAAAASADDNRYGYYYNDRYYGGNESYNGNRNYGNRNYGDQYYGGGYGNDAVSPRAIVHDLQRQGFTYIARPVRGGQFYQVKARDPNGRKVKLYIDAYSGRIVKVKS